MPVRNLTIYDLLANVLPGSLFLILLIPLFSILASLGDQLSAPSFLSLGDSILAIIFLIIGYVVGTLLQGIAERPIKVRGTALGMRKLEETYDRKTINTTVYNTEEFNRPFDTQLIRRYNHGNGEQIIEKCEEIFDRKFTKEKDGKKLIDPQSLGTLYWLIQSYLFTRGIERAQRWSLLEKFYRGTWVAFILSIIFNSVGLVIVLIFVYVFQMSNPISITLVLVQHVVILSSIGGSIVAHQERRKYGRYWGSALIDDFFTNTLSSTSQL